MVDGRNLEIVISNKTVADIWLQQKVPFHLYILKKRWLKLKWIAAKTFATDIKGFAEELKGTNLAPLIKSRISADRSGN